MQNTHSVHLWVSFLYRSSLVTAYLKYTTMTQAKWMHHNNTDHVSATRNYGTLEFCKSSINIIYKVGEGTNAQQERMSFDMTDKWTKTLKIFLWHCRDATLNLLQNSCQRWSMKNIIFMFAIFCHFGGKKRLLCKWICTNWSFLPNRGVLFLICICMTYTVLGYTCVAYSVSVCMYKIVTTQKVKPFLRRL